MGSESHFESYWHKRAAEKRARLVQLGIFAAFAVAIHGGAACFGSDALVRTVGVTAGAAFVLGWYLLAGTSAQLFGFVLIVAGTSAAPLVAWYFRPSPAFLIISAMIWCAWGYLFTATPFLMHR